jgi:hypothetical protein
MKSKSEIIEREVLGPAKGNDEGENNILSGSIKATLLPFLTGLSVESLENEVVNSR